jgi:site-specific recombinase XerD
VRIADCVRCDGGIGRKGTDLCHRCRATDREAARRGHCRTCGAFLRLSPETGRCVTCSRICVDCGHVVRFKNATRCRDCRRRHEAAAAKRPCPRCGRLGFIRATTGWCGACSRPAPAPLPALPCPACGALVRKRGRLLCGRCWQKHPDRARNQADNLADALEDPPWWLGDFADFAGDRHCMGQACVIITGLGRLLRDGQPAHPQALLERSRRPGRSAGALARTLEDFFVAHDLAFGLDQAARLAAGRRQRRVDGTPEPLRPAVALFCEHLVRSRERARRAGTHIRSDSTIEGAIAHVRDLARFLVDERAKTDWATAQTDDLEAFLNAQPGNRRRRLSTARQFFRWARQNKVVLIDPTTTITLTPRPGFTGTALTTAEQRRLFRRWTSGQPDVHPHEALVGLLAMLHALTGMELRALHAADVDLAARSMRVGGRPHPVPLDPASVAAIEACLAHRASLQTQNPHLIVTKVTKPRNTPASPAYLTHVLDPAGVRTKTLRSTRLIDLLISLDPKVVAEALGMNADGLLAYVIDGVDPARLAASNL